MRLPVVETEFNPVETQLSVVDTESQPVEAHRLSADENESK